jgi:acyl carrier protein
MSGPFNGIANSRNACTLQPYIVWARSKQADKGGIVENQVRDQLREFIRTSYLFGDDSRMPADDESLIESGIVDSTGVLELIEFLESTYGVEVSETETVPANLGSIANITGFVSRKLDGPPVAPAAQAS